MPRQASSLLRLQGAFPWLLCPALPRGWAALAWDLAEDLEDLFGRQCLLRAHASLELAEDRGRLRSALVFHGASAPPGFDGRADALRAEAASRAARTCRACGRPAVPRLGGPPLCLEHRDGVRRCEQRWA